MKRKRRRVRADRIPWTTQPFCTRPARRPAARGLGSTAKVAVAARPQNDEQGANPLPSETEGCQRKGFVTQRQDYKWTI